MKKSLLGFGLATLTAVPLLWAGNSEGGMIDESGLKPWEPCALCHSLDGISRMAKFPKLAGQSSAYLEKQIRDFREGRRENDGGQMKAMAETIAEKDIPAVARYFAGLEPPTSGNSALSSVTIPKSLFESGDAKRALPACLSCHGSTNLEISGAPLLQAQHADYLIKQLNDFRDGERRNDPAGVMTSVAKALTDQEIETLGIFISTQPRTTK